jgi:hypothetical protein
VFVEPPSKAQISGEPRSVLRALLNSIAPSQLTDMLVSGSMSSR